MQKEKPRDHNGIWGEFIINQRCKNIDDKFYLNSPNFTQINITIFFIKV